MELGRAGRLGIAGLRAAAGSARPDAASTDDGLPGRAESPGSRGPGRRRRRASPTRSPRSRPRSPAWRRLWAAEPPSRARPRARRGSASSGGGSTSSGAVNPYAVDEYAELKARLETLETQAADLRTAIVRTRDLIAELDAMIADRFRTTFAALESRLRDALRAALRWRLRAGCR